MSFTPTRRSFVYGALIFAMLFIFQSFVIAQEPQREKDEAGPREQQEWFYSQRAFPAKKTPPGARARAYKQVMEMRAKEMAARAKSNSVLPPSWQLVGPQPTNTPYFYSATSGRVTAVAIDPSDPTGNTVYLGGADGGVWKTTNGGTNWTPLTDNQFSLAIGSIAVDPNNPTNVYVGTGEENFNGDAYYGGGLLKSTDSGATWSTIGSAAFGGPLLAAYGGSYIGSIAIQPSASGTPVILVATQYASTSEGFGAGIYRSTDGGSSWTRENPTTSDSGAYGTSVFFVSNTTAYAAIGDLFGDASNGIYVSTNAGATWTASNGSGGTAIPSGNSTGRITLVGAPSNSSVLYASIQNPANYGLLNMYKSTDGGATWNPLGATPLGDAGGTADFCGTQCWYDMPLGVSPSNPNVLYAGGSFNYNQGNGGIYMTSDGGSTWTDINPFPASNVGIHPDFHEIIIGGSTPKMYIGDDGGIWSTPNVGTTSVTWTNLNSTLAITQFYPGLAVSTTNANLAYNGTQDNGTQKYTGTTTWSNVTCGDGAWTAIDPTNNNNVYSGCTPGNAYAERSTDGGNTWSVIDNGISGSDSVDFIPPLIMDPTTSTTLYFGTSRVYKMLNSTSGSPTWSPISANLPTSGNYLTTIAVAPQNSSNLYAGSSNGGVFYSTNAGSSWNSLPTMPRSVTMVQADPAVLGTFYVTLSGFSGFSDSVGHVFQCTTAGTCADISGNFPNTPADDIVIDPDVANTYYVAADDGVFASSNGGTTWGTLSSGLPNVAVVGLKLQRSSRTLLAATHGRSTWSLAVPLGNTPATMSTPTPGTTLPSASATFTWTTGRGVTQYLLIIGTTPGAHDVDEINTGTATSQLVSNLPTGGAPLYVKLLSDINGVWQTESYTYTQAGVSSPATLTSPTPGSTLTGPSATFNWSTGSGVTGYLLYVGTTLRGHDILDQTYPEGTTSATVSGIPENAATLYVTLFSSINGAWQSQSYTYLETGTPATISSPASGTTLSGATATFNWTATPGTGVKQYQLFIGTSSGLHNVDSINTGTATTATVSNLPTGGANLYVELMSDINGAWVPEYYTYTQFGTTAPATMISPAPGTILGGSSVPFSWTTGSGATEYMLYVGTTPRGHDIYDQVLGTTGASVTGIPTTGGTVYVTLFSLINGSWQSNTYTYTEQ